MPASLINSLLIQSFKAWFPAYTGNLAFNLLGTLAIEIPLAFALGLRGRKNAWTVFEVNVMTNPIVVTILFGLVRTSLSMPVVRGILFLMECVVVWTEGMLYKNRLTEAPMNPFKLSLILNAVSYGTGVVLELISLL